MGPGFVPRTVPAAGGSELSGESQVDIWYAALDLDQEPSLEALSTLSRDERKRASGMAHVPKRRFIASRVLLRHLLASYLSTEADAIELTYDTNGKPSLAVTDRARELHFNLSHSGHRALFAFGPFAIGVDLEAIRPLRDPDALAGRFFSAHERRALARLPEGSRQRSFFACWTRKEACVKALGTGIANSLPGFSVTLDPASEPARLGESGEPDRDWTLYHLEPENGVIGAVAANQPECELRCWSIVRPGNGTLHKLSPSMKLVS